MKRANQVLAILTLLLSCGGPLWAGEILPSPQYDLFQAKDSVQPNGSPREFQIYTKLNPGVSDGFDLNPRDLSPGEFQKYTIIDSRHAAISINEPANTAGSILYFGIKTEFRGKASDPIDINTQPDVLFGQGGTINYSMTGSDKDGDNFQIHLVIQSQQTIDPNSFTALNPQLLFQTGNKQVYGWNLKRTEEELPPGGEDYLGLQRLSWDQRLNRKDPPLIVQFDITDLSNGQLLQLSAVPEPASLTLLCLGTAGLAGYAWRRRRNMAPV